MGKRVAYPSVTRTIRIACLASVLGVLTWGHAANAQEPGRQPSEQPGQQAPQANTPPLVIEPIVPPLPNSAIIMSVQCAVPVSHIAAPAPLARMAEQLEKKQQLRILAIGSSSTWGVGASGYKRNYPSQLERILEKNWKGLDVEIINRGVSGELAAATARRLIDEAALVRPDLVLWQLGTNDALARIPAADFALTVRKTVRMLRQKNMDVVLVGLQYTPRYARDDHYVAIRNILKDIATQEGLLYVRRYQAMEFIARNKANQQMMAEDNFHLNDLGYQCMAEHVAQAVIGSLFLRKPRTHPRSGPRT